MPALGRALNKVDLPTFGSPTIPHLSDMSPYLYIVLTTALRSTRRKPNATDRDDSGAAMLLSPRVIRAHFCFLRGLRGSFFRFFGLRMQPMHRRLHLAFEHQRPDGKAALHGVRNQLGLRFPRRMEHVVDHFVLVTGMADTDAQPPEIRSQFRGDIF